MSINLKFNDKCFNYLKNKNIGDLITDLEALGQGVFGTIYKIRLEGCSEEFALKEIDTDYDGCLNEYNALKFLRENMINNTLPHYYPFLYGSFIEDNIRSLVMEKFDYLLSDLQIEFNFDTLWYKQTFTQIAEAVHYLESLEFNHGDLWEDNIMLNWITFEENINLRKFCIKLIDFDCAFKTNSDINKPNLGGSDFYRKKFLLGYDMNRLFDAMLYSNKQYIKNKLNNKKKRIRKFKLKIKPSQLPDNKDDLEYDDVNTILPTQILTFMKEMKPRDPSVLQDYPKFSGQNIIKRLELI